MTSATLQPKIHRYISAQGDVCAKFELNRGGHGEHALVIYSGIALVPSGVQYFLAV